MAGEHICPWELSNGQVHYKAYQLYVFPYESYRSIENCQLFITILSYPSAYHSLALRSLNRPKLRNQIQEQLKGCYDNFSSYPVQEIIKVRVWSWEFIVSLSILVWRMNTHSLYSRIQLVTIFGTCTKQMMTRENYDTRVTTRLTKLL